MKYLLIVPSINKPSGFLQWTVWHYELQSLNRVFLVCTWILYFSDFEIRLRQLTETSGVQGFLWPPSYCLPTNFLEIQCSLRRQTGDIVYSCLPISRAYHTFIIHSVTAFQCDGLTVLLRMYFGDFPLMMTHPCSQISVSCPFCCLLLSFMDSQKQSQTN